VGTLLHNYQEVRAYLEKKHPDRLQALMPRHINAPADYWPQKELAVSSANAAMQNYVDINEHQTKPNPALAAVQGQAALLLRYEVPTYLCLTGTPGPPRSAQSGLHRALPKAGRANRGLCKLSPI
jgi:hypothetical protein